MISNVHFRKMLAAIMDGELNGISIEGRKRLKR